MIELARQLISGQSSARWWAPPLFGALLYLTALRVDLSAQLTLAALCLLACCWALRRAPRLTRRLLVLGFCAFLSLRYAYWRVTDTISFHDVLSFVVAGSLLLAELQSVAMHLLGMFICAHPLHRRPVPLPQDLSRWPTVDVMVPSYNEPAYLLEITLLAALNLRYAPAKVRVYLLDDGGTDQKCNDSEPERAAAARTRRRELMALCERVGVHYLTRDRNVHAKAGNINAALSKTCGELILILDADHVPTVDLLENTVGSFLADDKLFLVQTPHFFISPDPIERNLRLYGEMPSENQMFYAGVQPGLDSWGASYFCGSAAVLRRCHVLEVGGLRGSSITEDAETALELHARGFNSAYISRPMVAGLQPETQAAFIAQRMRWAQGMVQILVMKNPLRLPGLTWPQRICYLTSISFWFFGYARAVFLLAPWAYLMFGLSVYDATLKQFAAYTLPHLIATLLSSNLLFGRFRWAFVSEVYELLQSPFSLRGIFRVLRDPRAPAFLVTPKGEFLEEDFISSFSKPFYVIYVASSAAVVVGVARLFWHPEVRDLTAVALAWQVLNLVLLNACIGALYERKQRRALPRVTLPEHQRAQISMTNGGSVPCWIKDLSANGSLLHIDAPDASAVTPETSSAVLTLYNSARHSHVRLNVRIRSRRSTADGKLAVGVEFDERNIASKAEWVAFALGDSDRWVRSLRRRQQQSPLRVFLRLAMRGTVYAAQHLGAILALQRRNVWNLGVELCRFGRSGHEQFRRWLAH